MKFVHTSLRSHGTIITVKTPNTLYIVFAIPHSKKYLLLKGQPVMAVLFLFMEKSSSEEREIDRSIELR